MFNKKTLKIKTYVFKIIIDRDDFENGTKAYHAHCPGLNGASTWGYTKEEALKNIQEVIKIVLESMIKHGEPLPKKTKNIFTISTDPLVAVTV